MLGTLIDVRMALVGLLLLGCNEDDRTTVDNRGSLCISQEGDELDINVVFEACTSPGCDRSEHARCEATVLGNQIHVTSHVEVVRIDSPGKNCPAICEAPQATCELVLAAPGTYQIGHGDLSGTITLPLDGPVPLGSDRACSSGSEANGDE